MSNAPFHDTVTLFLATEDPAVWEVRRIGKVKCQISESLQETDRRATIYLPLCGRRALRYRTPIEFQAKPSPDSFTVRPGDRLVPSRINAIEPPSEALTVTTVIPRIAGTRRLWHLEILASYLPYEAEEEETDQTETDSVIDGEESPV